MKNFIHGTYHLLLSNYLVVAATIDELLLYAPPHPVLEVRW